jgi:hypothetical protein
MSSTEQGPLPATLLPAIPAAALGLFPWARGEASAASPPPLRTLKSQASFHRYHIFIRSARKHNFNLMRAYRGQVPLEVSPASPESALQTYSGKTQILLNKCSARTG